MGRKPNVYSKIEAADDMIKKLCEKQAKVLWTVTPSQVIVLGIDNKERSKKNRTLAKIRPVKGTEKAIYQVNNIPIRYIIECYWMDWNVWHDKVRKAILFHELMHVHPEGERTVKHDLEDFKIIIDALGVDWTKNDADLPDLANDDVSFNLALLPSIDDEETEEDNIDEDKINKEKKEKKAKKDSKEEPKEEEAKEDMEEETENK